MLWNTDPTGICLVFPSLQITSTSSLIFYLLFLIALSILFEYTRLATLSADRALRSTLRRQTFPLAPSSLPPRHPSPSPSSLRPSPISPTYPADHESLLGPAASLGAGAGKRWGSVRLPVGLQARRSAFYVANMALSFYLMLVVMSYNAWLIGAMLVGAGVGHFVFTREFDLDSVGVEEEGKAICH